MTPEQLHHVGGTVRTDSWERQQQFLNLVIVVPLRVEQRLQLQFAVRHAARDRLHVRHAVPHAGDVAKPRLGCHSEAFGRRERALAELR